MKAQDLRIGNWIFDNGTMTKVAPSHILELWEADRLWIQPIPLTPEILEKCGFEKFKGLWNYKLVPIGYELNLVKINGLNENEFENQIGESIKHLHHLQNLYYALTGEELHFKP